MEGKRTTARRSRRTATTRPAPVAATKQPARPKAAKSKVGKSGERARTVTVAAAPTFERQRMVEMAAYFRAESRGFEPGRELEDWFVAEAEIEAQLAPVPQGKPVRRSRKPAVT